MTVTEIARRAGVSIGTVDRVLHNRGRVSPETKEKIQAIIESEGYQPNPLARHLKRNKGYKIGLLIPEVSKESGYWALMYESLKKASTEYSAFSFEIQLFEFIRPDRKSLADAFERMTESDCCAYIMAPVMQEETLVLLLGKKIKVPYCFIDSPLPGAEPICVVAQEPYKAGLLAGKLMELVSSKKGTYLVLRPYSEAFNLNERVRGFIDWFKDKEDITVKGIVGKDSSDESLAYAVKDMLKMESVIGICTVNSATHKIAHLVEEAGLRDKIAVVGFDLVDMNRKYLEDGKIDCLISQSPEEQGRQALSQLFRVLVLEEGAENLIEMPFDIYFKENLI